VTNSYNYIVVGGGTAGAVMAARLSENPENRVLLIEAGAEQGPPTMADPAAAGTLWFSEVDWAYLTTPQSGTDGAVHIWPRGKVLGGSSAINMMLHLRGDAASYDAWEKLGARGWNHASMLPFLRRSETAVGRDDDARGQDGPMRIEAVPAPGLLAQAWFDAAVEAGHSPSPDGNGKTAEGVSWTDMNVVAGRRQSAADAYLRPVLGRPNLSVVTGAHARQLLLDGTTCVGVAYTHDGREHTAQADREVVLTAGVIGSPHLLLLSGVGPADHLRDKGVDVRLDLPGVGANLHDHPLSSVSYRSKRPVLEDGPQPMPHVLARTRPDADPDIQLGFAPAVLLPRWSGAEPDGFSISVGLMTPRSRGSLRLRSADPAESPDIDPGYFTDPDDLDRMVAGVRLARAVGESSALMPWRSGEAHPGDRVRSDEELRAYLRASAGSYFHGVGTCRMGMDELAVVDEHLKVRGVDHLRVADASVMPSIVSANTNATVLAIAERGAALLLG
jgi:choline dehydrogenase